MPESSVVAASSGKERAHVYRIFRSDERDLRAVKQGFSWPGFFFHLGWAAANGMWVLALGTTLGAFAGLLAFAAIAQSAAGVAGVLAIVAELALFSVYGVRGNQWLARRLIRRGYLASEEVAASSRSSAEQLAQQNRSAV